MIHYGLGRWYHSSNKAARCDQCWVTFCHFGFEIIAPPGFEIIAPPVRFSLAASMFRFFSTTLAFDSSSLSNQMANHHGLWFAWVLACLVLHHFQRAFYWKSTLCSSYQYNRLYYKVHSIYKSSLFLALIVQNLPCRLLHRRFATQRLSTSPL